MKSLILEGMQMKEQSEIKLVTRAENVVVHVYALFCLRYLNL